MGELRTRYMEFGDESKAHRDFIKASMFFKVPYKRPFLNRDNQTILQHSQFAAQSLCGNIDVQDFTGIKLVMRDSHHVREWLL